MHSYLRAIGFSKVNNRKELDNIIGMVMNQPTEKYITKLKDSGALTELKKDFGDSIGLAVRGEYDEQGIFHLEHYYPYFYSHTVTEKEEVAVNKRVDTDAYTGMCDDLRLGVSLIFYLQNVIDYVDHKKVFMKNPVVPIYLAALSNEGKILLGMEISEKHVKNHSAQIMQRNQLIAEAKEGNQDAIDSLTIDDIDMYATISRRARQEDVYSIVDTSFIPYGSESDNYSVIGTIVNWSTKTNTMTGEEVYMMHINCNDLIFAVCINRKDLVGEPLEGRRFKGNIWMQGRIDFSPYHEQS